MEYLRSSSWCRNWPVRGKKRCRLHGGFATGPRTPEGKARTIAAMVEGRRRLLEKLATVHRGKRHCPDFTTAFGGTTDIAGPAACPAQSLMTQLRHWPPICCDAQRGISYPDVVECNLRI
jgi:hypothetical protein